MPNTETLRKKGISFGYRKVLEEVIYTYVVGSVCAGTFGTLSSGESYTGDKHRATFYLPAILRPRLSTTKIYHCELYRRVECHRPALSLIGDWHILLPRRRRHCLEVEAATGCRNHHHREWIHCYCASRQDHEVLAVHSHRRGFGFVRLAIARSSATVHAVT